MSNIVSKNAFDVLGNDLDDDTDKESEQPTRAVEKTLPRTTKRNAPEAAGASPRGHADVGRGGRGARLADADNAYNDRSRAKPTDDGLRQDRHPARLAGGSRDDGTYGGRGGRGGARGRRGARDDRHSRTGRVDTEKEVAQGWGAQTGEAEWGDEKAGEAIAQADEKEAATDTAPEVPVDAEGNHPAGDGDKNEPAAEPEPVDNTKSYADYLAEQAAKKLDLGTPEARKPNENAKPDKKWAQAKELKRDEEEDAFIAGSGPKANKRDRQRKEKTFVDIEHRPMEPQRGGRGGRGRGEGRGEYRGRGRGEGRGGHFRGRRERGGGGDGVNVSDTNAFPTLGGT
ncbi:MAG: hypothetical protein M1816_004443 [Peltula sp. TS41687]|nr:MAG: hypothetical protein M1816_004443 [Peltula sp. TS41687]